MESSKVVKRSRSLRAGLKIPVWHALWMIRKHAPKKRMAKGVDVFLTAVVQYLGVRVLERCVLNSVRTSKAIKMNHYMRVTPEDVRKAMNSLPALGPYSTSSIVYGSSIRGGPIDDVSQVDV